MALSDYCNAKPVVMLHQMIFSTNRPVINRLRVCWAPCMLLLAVLCSLANTSTARDNPASLEYEIKAAFLYKFGQYVDWPENSFENKESPIVIGVAASADFVGILRSATSHRSIHNRPIEVRQITDGDPGQPHPGQLHLLFIGRSHDQQIQRLISQTRGTPTLIITENNAGLDYGGVIGFIIEDERVRFDINLTAAQQRDLYISAQLLKVARVVRGAP